MPLIASPPVAVIIDPYSGLRKFMRTTRPDLAGAASACFRDQCGLPSSQPVPAFISTACHFDPVWFANHHLKEKLHVKD